MKRLNKERVGVRVRERMGVAAGMVLTACAGGVPAMGQGGWTVTYLHPSIAERSAAHATTGTPQVGQALIGGDWHASLWSGTASSWVDLNPVDSTLSLAHATSGSQQAGYAYINNVGQASVWSGTAASWVSLHPAGATVSEAYDTTGTQQVGYAAVGDKWHASLWSGTASSWVDLNPASAEQSWAGATTGSQQVGWAVVGGVTRSSLWSGTAESWEDLSLALNGSWSESFALGIWSDGTMLYVAGYGYNKDMERSEALLWTRPIATACYPDCDGSGALDIDDFVCFQTLYALGDPTADCDQSGELNIDDFVCFQTLFALGC